VIVATALLVAFLVTTGIFLPALGELGRLASHDPNAAAARISMCGREWTRSNIPAQTRDEIVARDGSEPVVVSTGAAPSCPPGARPDGPTGALATVVYVKTGPDAYVAYELVGGP
jgi:hypothetical protein